MEGIYKLKERLWDELEEMSEKSDISLYDLDTIHKLTDTIKNICKITMLESGEYDDEESHERGRSYSRNGSNRGGGYNRDMSYARNRDRRGRYSGDNGHMMDQLEDMMHEAGNDNDREAIRRVIERMRG